MAFSGRAALINDGLEVTILSRRKKEASDGVGKVVLWDAKTLDDWHEELDGAFALFNLTGRSVDCRYTQKNKDLILKRGSNFEQEGIGVLQEAKEYDPLFFHFYQSLKRIEVQSN